MKYISLFVWAIILFVYMHEFVYIDKNEFLKTTEKQQLQIDSLKQETIRLDSILVSWDLEYQENLEESNNLVNELNQ